MALFYAGNHPSYPSTNIHETKGVEKIFESLDTADCVVKEQVGLNNGECLLDLSNKISYPRYIHIILKNVNETDLFSLESFISSIAITVDK